VELWLLVFLSFLGLILFLFGETSMKFTKDGIPLVLFVTFALLWMVYLTGGLRKSYPREMFIEHSYTMPLPKFCWDIS